MKPADISQEVWEEALVASDEAGQAMGSIWGSEFGAVVIARAIQRAVERERDAIGTLLKDPIAVRVNYLRGGIACQAIIDEAVNREREDIADFCAAQTPTVGQLFANAIRARGK